MFPPGAVSGLAILDIISGQPSNIYLFTALFKKL